MNKLNSSVTVPKAFALGLSPRSLLAKLLLSIIVLVVFFLVPEKIGFYPLGSGGFAIKNSILFPFFHANIFHALCNVMCLWCLKGRLYLFPAFVISLLCSFLPEPSLSISSTNGVMGLSGVLFAIIGIKYGRFSVFSRLVKNTWLFFLVTLFIPNVAFLFHLYCVLLGFAYGYVVSIYVLWRKRICL